MGRRKIIKYKSGLTLIHKKDKRKESVYFEFRFAGGLFNDPKDKLGLSHFTEHAVGFTNSKFTHEQKDSYWQKLSKANFVTSRVRISFYAHVADEEFDEAFSTYANYLSDFKIDEQEFENERKVILQEILRRRIDLTEEMGMLESENIYKNIGNNNNDFRIRPFGTIEHVKNITLEDINQNIKDTFALNNCQITVYGNIGLSRVKKLIKKHVEPQFNKKTDKVFYNFDDVVTYKNKPVFAKSDSPDEERSLIRVYHQVIVPKDRLLIHASKVATSIIETSAHEFFRNKCGLCYSCGTGLSTVPNTKTDEYALIFSLTIRCNQENVKTVLQKLPEYYEFLANYPINDESVEKSKTYIRRYEKVLSVLDFSKKGSNMANRYFNFNYFYTPKENKKLKKREDNLETGYVLDTFKKSLSSKPYIFVVSNTKDELPEYNKLCKEIKKATKWILE